MSDLLIVNAHAVDAAAGIDGPRDLLIRDGKIAGIEPVGAFKTDDSARLPMGNPRSARVVNTPDKFRRPGKPQSSYERHRHLQ